MENFIEHRCIILCSLSRKRRNCLFSPPLPLPYSDRPMLSTCPAHTNEKGCEILFSSFPSPGDLGRSGPVAFVLQGQATEEYLSFQGFGLGARFRALCFFPSREFSVERPLFFSSFFYHLPFNQGGLSIGRPLALETPGWWTKWDPPTISGLFPLFPFTLF